MYKKAGTEINLFLLTHQSFGKIWSSGKILVSGFSRLKVMTEFVPGTHFTNVKITKIWTSEGLKKGFLHGILIVKDVRGLSR